MNVIVTNKYASMLESLNIDIIKKMEGEFTVDQIISTFQNFFFQRMILDITAIKDYRNIENIQLLATSLDMDKVILLLDDSPESTSPAYLSKLISIGIYNFAKNVEGIMYLYNNPNSYRDVAQYHQLNLVQQPAPSKQETPTAVPEQTINTVQNEFHEQRIIGISNLNQSAGATTFVYMMKKQLSKNYKVGVIEVEKKDFAYFRDKEMISSSLAQLDTTIKRFKSCDVILIDTNKKEQAESKCDEIIYLLEPSTIKLNKMMSSNPRAMASVKGKKLVLNQSCLSNKDVLQFEAESGVKIFYNMPALDEREDDIKALDPFLLKLGFGRQQDGENTKRNNVLGFLGI